MQYMPGSRKPQQNFCEIFEKKNLLKKDLFVLNRDSKLTHFTIMSLASVSKAPPNNVNHPSHQQPKQVRNQHQQPSVQNAKGPQTPTEAARSNQDTGNHTQVQTLDTQADLSNPLTSQQFNSKIAATRF